MTKQPESEYVTMWRIENRIRYAYTNQGMREFSAEQFLANHERTYAKVRETLTHLCRLVHEGRLEMRTSKPDNEGLIAVSFVVSEALASVLDVRVLPDHGSAYR